MENVVEFNKNRMDIFNDNEKQDIRYMSGYIEDDNGLNNFEKKYGENSLNELMNWLK